MTRAWLLAAVLAVPGVLQAQEQSPSPPPLPPPEDVGPPPPTPPPEPAAPAPPLESAPFRHEKAPPYKYVPKPRESDLPPADHRLSITFSPFHVFAAIAEVTGELRIFDWLSASLVLGGGVPLGIPAFELGGQVCGYPVGSFEHGMQVGAEVLGLFAIAPVGTQSTATAGGVSAGPFVGYKVAARVGFTFMAQLGAQYTFVGAQSGNQTASSQGFGVLLNLNVGWSF